MKKLIIILSFIPLIADSGEYNNELNDLLNTLQIVNDSFDCNLQNQSTINYMNNKKLQLLSKIDSCLSR